MVSPRGDNETRDVALTEQKVMMLNQPRAGASHELHMVEDDGGFLAKISHQPAFGMRCELAAPEQSQRRRVMFEQSPATPAIECPDRGDPRRHAIELPAKVIEDLRWNEFHGIADLLISGRCQGLCIDTNS